MRSNGRTYQNAIKNFYTYFYTGPYKKKESLREMQRRFLLQEDRRNSRNTLLFEKELDNDRKEE